MLTFVLPFLVFEPELIKIPCNIVQKVIIGIIIDFPIFNIFVTEYFADGRAISSSVENLNFLLYNIMLLGRN